MPVFDYKCRFCGEIHRDVFRSSDEDTATLECQCGKKALRYWGETRLMFDRVFGAHDMEGYHCPVTDEYVTSRKRRREIIRENNLEECGGSDRKTLAQRRKDLGGAKPPSAKPIDEKAVARQRKQDIIDTVQELRK